MTLLVTGLAVIAVTAVLFWFMLPRNGQRHRFVETEWEPYVGVAFTAAVALGMTMTLSAVLRMMS
jgi:hypothetical protein